jgi:hypothetical protein
MRTRLKTVHDIYILSDQTGILSALPRLPSEVTDQVKFDNFPLFLDLDSPLPPQRPPDDSPAKEMVTMMPEILEFAK